MFEDKEKEVQKPGKPWKNTAYKPTYGEADVIRKERIAAGGLEVKVKWLPSMEKFVVKTRSLPELKTKKEKSTT